MDKIFAILLLLICQPASAAEWTTKTTVDEMDGSTKSKALLMSETGESLNLMCEKENNGSRSIYAWVNANIFLGSGRIPVDFKSIPSINKIETLNYKIDNKGTSFIVGVEKSNGPVKIKESDFGSYDEYVSALLEDTDDLFIRTSNFFTKVFSSEKILFRYKPFRENTRTVKFITKASEKSLTDIIKNCQITAGSMLSDSELDKLNRSMDKVK